MLLANAILQNRYRVIRKLGHGGMGTVYEAIDQRVDCIVAVKEMSVPGDGEARQAFGREASLLANLRHQALPKVMDYFSENDGNFLVMEFITGQDLAKMLASRGSAFPLSQVLGWADELLKLLEYLHTRRPPILHRDIKPANLKLTDQGEIFLLDFGLAKGSIGQMPTLATSRSVFGYTRSYASLEQILGQGTDPRSDLYSLGATLYHLLAGVPPADAPTRFKAIEDELPDPLPSIEEVNPQVSGNVAVVIRHAMAIKSRQRPTSAVEMRKALCHAIEEDERHSAEEENRRAELRIQRREEERRRAAADLARKEEERQKRGAETRRKEADALRLGELGARRKAEKEAARRVEEETRRGAEPPPTTLKAHPVILRSTLRKPSFQLRRRAGRRGLIITVIVVTVVVIPLLGLLLWVGLFWDSR